MASATNYVDRTHVGWALSLMTISSSEKLVLLALAHYADQLRVCRPSVQRLVKMTQLSPSTVYRALAELEEREIITRWQTAKTNVYTLHMRPVQGLTEGQIPTVTANPPASTTTSSTYGGDRSYFQTTSERPFGRRKPKPKAKRSSSTRSTGEGAIRVVTAERAQPTQEAVAQAQGEHLIARGVDPSVARPEGVQRISWSDFRSLKKALNVRKEKPMPAPGFPGDDDSPAPKPRRGAEEEPSFGNAGRLQDDAEKKPKRTKKLRHWQITPIEEWSCNDLTDYARHLAREKNPLLVDQIPRGWALGDFSRWLKGGASAEILREMIDDFYGDEINFRLTTDKTPLWPRLRRAITNDLADAVDRKPRTPQPVAVVADEVATPPLRRDPMEKHYRALAALKNRKENHELRR